jgi:hypothetical protein
LGLVQLVEVDLAFELLAKLTRHTARLPGPSPHLRDQLGQLLRPKHQQRDD